MQLEDLLSSPLWLPASVSLDSLVFEEISEDTLRKSPFLDARAVGRTGKKLPVPLKTLFEQEEKIFAAAGPIHEIFHISHVGSTFVARLLENFPDSVVYKEPPILNGLTAQIQEDQQGLAYFDRDTLLRINAIIYGFMSAKGHKTIIKHTSQNLLLPRALQGFGLDIRPALYLYTDLQDFLCHGLASQGLQLDSHNNIRNRVIFMNAVALNEKFIVSQLDPLQKMAVLWMAEMLKLILRSAPEQGDRLFDFDAEFAAKDRTAIVTDLATHFSYDLTPETVQGVVTNPVWESNSKIAQKHSFKDRQANIKANAKTHKESLATTLNWARSICQKNITLHKLLPFIEAE